MLAPVLLQIILSIASEPTRRPAEIEALTDQARTLPPEFSSDALLRIATLPAVADRKWRRELIDEAFVSAASAQLPARRVGGGSTDSRFGPAALGSDHALDRLSLQARAVEAMIPIDRRRALEMFRDVRVPELPAVKCDSFVLLRVDANYEALTKVFSSSFTEEERRKEHDFAMVDDAIRGMHSDVQIGPVAHLICRLDAPRARTQEWLDAFAYTLSAVEGTERTFNGDAMRALTEISEIAKSKGLRRGPLLSAVRQLALSRLRGPRCKDLIRNNGIERWVPSLNKEIESEIANGNGELRPINLSEEERGPVAAEGENPFWWQSARSKAVLESLRWLNHGNRELPDDKRFWTLEERSTQEWNDRYLELVNTLGDWEASEGETVEDTFHMRAITYASLARLVPPGKAQANAVPMAIAFLEESYASISNRAEWFEHVDDLLARGTKDVRDQAKLSSNPVIALYSRLITDSRR